MRRLGMLGALVCLICASLTFAQSETQYLSIPSSAFTPRTSEGGYGGNETGTARSFGSVWRMFAPVNLPHGSSVKSMQCGGTAASKKFRLVFTLRRNEPQQANVDMATATTDFEEVGFQFVDTAAVSSPAVNNARYNYYIAAEAEALDVGFCSKCSIGYCRLGYEARR